MSHGKGTEGERILNNRPREVLNFRTPSEAFKELTGLSPWWCSSRLNGPNLGRLPKELQERVGKHLKYQDIKQYENTEPDRDIVLDLARGHQQAHHQEERQYRLSMEKDWERLQWDVTHLATDIHPLRIQVNSVTPDNLGRLLALCENVSSLDLSGGS